MRLEGDYKPELIKRIRNILPGCFILKNDANYMQGVPDLIILWESYWIMLEVKRSATAKERPNQRYYIELLNEMSFAAFIYPENEEEVLDEIQRQFKARRTTRVSKRK